MKDELKPKYTSRTSKPALPPANRQKRFTGRKIVILNTSTPIARIEGLAADMSIRMANSRDFSSIKNPREAASLALTQADGVVFDKLKVAVVNEPYSAEVDRLTTGRTSGSVFLTSEKERYVYALGTSVRRSNFEDDDTATWGIHATSVLNSTLTGKGVRVAILDSGLSMKHPDFGGRRITAKSFVRRQLPNDRYGHGSHCTGIAVGNVSIEKGFRYGVAPQAEIYIGKVLDNNGEGEDNNVLAGIDWALENGCKVISLSLGSSVKKGETYYESYETVAKRAMGLGSLIVAAAGNDSKRKRGKIKFINHPANCPSIMCVAALDNRLEVAEFSCASAGKKQGIVDIAAPGVDIFSASVRNTYEILSGTSMATPFVAGLAALLWQKNPSATPMQIWKKLVSRSKRLRQRRTDVGAGLAIFR